ncbi:hypothetical protein BpHYR1_040540, partial [Brachionus plicatilis]
MEESMRINVFLDAVTSVSSRSRCSKNEDNLDVIDEKSLASCTVNQNIKAFSMSEQFQKLTIIYLVNQAEIDCKCCKIVAELLTSSLSEDKKLHLIDSLLKAKKNEKATDNSMSNIKHNKKQSKKENIASTSSRNSSIST